MKSNPPPGHNKRQATRAVMPSMAKMLKSPKINFIRKMILPSFTTRGLAHVDRDSLPKDGMEGICRDGLLRRRPLDREPHPEGDCVRHQRVPSTQVGAIVVAGAMRKHDPPPPSWKCHFLPMLTPSWRETSQDEFVQSFKK